MIGGPHHGAPNLRTFLRNRLGCELDADECLRFSDFCYAPCRRFSRAGASPDPLAGMAAAGRRIPGDFGAGSPKNCRDTDGFRAGRPRGLARDRASRSVMSPSAPGPAPQSQIFASIPRWHPGCNRPGMSSCGVFAKRRARSRAPGWPGWFASTDGSRPHCPAPRRVLRPGAGGYALNIRVCPDRSVQRRSGRSSRIPAGSRRGRHRGRGTARAPAAGTGRRSAGRPRVR